MVLRGKRVRLVQGLGFKSPFPWSAFYALDDFHLQLGVKGAYVYAPHRVDSRKPLGHGAVYLDYAAITELAARDRELLVNGKTVAKAPSAKAAERMVRDLDAIRRLPEKKREEAARKLIAAQVEPEAAVNVRTDDDGALRSLRVFATIHAVVVAALVVAIVFGHIDRWKAMLSALAVMLLAGTLQFVRAHKKLWPSDRAHRWTRAATCVLSPVGILKSPDVCTHDRLADVHLLAAVRAFMTDSVAGPMIAQALRDARHPGKKTWIDSEPKAGAAQREHRENVIAVLETIAPAPVAKAAADNDEGVVVRCPRCGAGYTRQVSECFDCGAVIERVS